MASEKHLLLALEMLTEGPSERVPEDVRAEALEVHKSAKPWTMGKGIQGVGIGQKITDGVMLDEVVLKVYVVKKRPKSEVDNLVPKKMKLDGIEADIVTDVEEIGKVKREPNTTRVRPAIPGFSIGHVNITAGTLGCLVRMVNDKRTLYILSNSHILADEGTGAQGDKIIQPGKYDGGAAPADVIAELAAWVPFTFTSTGFPNTVDAAIAKVKSAKVVTSLIRLIGVPAGINKNIRRGMQVQKTGRTTDHTVGIVNDVNYRLPMRYKKPGGGAGRAGMRDQILCTRYTAGGDSGSAVLDMQKRVVGLHFAGSPSTSIFNRIENVLNALHIAVVTTKI